MWFFEENKKIIGEPVVVIGVVDEYEPETIWLEIKNIERKDVAYFNDIAS